ncbi:DNA-binding transcription factor, zf-fungal binuclear cluster type [Schizosaccharomyces pombe]|uniref:DNA-binding transcription factor ntu1 n=1 Tax=Schizosaccharomyces pombe (strain 972 / ATCC 24843) TaxID=284812 RepID=NTU1_SCHPO|nr:putative transcription factor [Schizosaccharomyces pombe]O60130.1 RecName: Full=Putative transcriptional regulatory protein C16G5.16 [Schizosaccharomyces pombe 972h-]CAA19035.1 transcription factor, zf-fungal binuclear cluster type (predicted) [Schizosaccharomyces pombe]|eukprot:NP_596765.1 putative transcription factor [Schizosaccharomyces pombe]
MSSGDVSRRQRVSRACDECHRRKIKCDQRRPCSNCIAYNYECTYGQPFKRLRHAPEKYIEFLELRLKYLRGLAEESDPNLKLPSFLAPPNDKDSPVNQSPWKRSDSSKRSSSQDEFESLFDRYGQLSLKDDGKADFRGSSSGFVFMKNIHQNIARNSTVPNPVQESNSSSSQPDPLSFPYLPPTPAEDEHKKPPLKIQLPPYEEALSIVSQFFMNDHFLVHIHHPASFFEKMHMYYKTGKTDNNFHFLLVATLCLGYTYMPDESPSANYPYHEAYEYYYYIRSSFSWEDSYTIEVVQILLSVALFALFSSRLSQAYTFTNNALLCCHELGLHKDFSDVLTSHESRLSKRVFYSVYVLACYTSTIVGLPLSIEDVDIDQSLPNSFDFTLENDQVPPRLIASECTSLEVFIQHITLSRILSHFVRKVYPVKSPSDSHCKVSLPAVRDHEEKLTYWWKNLPSYLKMSEVPKFSPKWIQAIILELKFRQIELIFYRPFIHSISTPIDNQNGSPMKPANFALKCAQSAERVVFLLQELAKSPNTPKLFFNLYSGYYALMTLTYCATLTKDDANKSNNFITKARLGFHCLQMIYRESTYYSTIMEAIKNLLIAYDMNSSGTENLDATPDVTGQLPNNFSQRTSNIPREFPQAQIFYSDAPYPGYYNPAQFQNAPTNFPMPTYGGRTQDQSYPRQNGYPSYSDGNVYPHDRVMINYGSSMPTANGFYVPNTYSPVPFPYNTSYPPYMSPTSNMPQAFQAYSQYPYQHPPFPLSEQMLPLPTSGVMMAPGAAKSGMPYPFIQPPSMTNQVAYPTVRDGSNNSPDHPSSSNSKRTE